MADTRRKWWLLGTMALAGLAWASPWDIDMIDSTAMKAFRWKMADARIEGTVQRPQGAITRAGSNGHYQNDYIEGHTRVDIGDSLHNPYPVDDKSLAQGKKLFQVSCAPCHGIEGKGDGPVTYNKPDTDPKKAIRRFPIPAPTLSGPGAVSTNRSDAYIYLTIRNGGQGIGLGMPPYGLSLTDEERWAIVSYLRTLDGAQYVPPQPVAPPAPQEGEK